MKWCKRAVLVLTALMAFGIPLVGASSASAMLSYVGPTLSSNPSKAKVQVETMLHHDHGVQAFYAGSLNVSTADIASAKVTNLKFGHCRIGVNPKCPINTGKDSSGNIVKTDFRFGEVRKVAYVELEIGKELFEITLEAPCVNLLNGGQRVHQVVPPRPPRPPHITVSPKKPITFQLVSTSYSVSESSSSASAECPAGTVASNAGSGAGAQAEAKATYKVYRQKRHSWGSLFAQINSISTTTYTNTGTHTSVTCTPNGTPPEPPKQPEPFTLKVNNLEEVQELYPGEERPICADVYAPAGDSLTITFVAHYGSFKHEVWQSNAYGGPVGYCDTYVAGEPPPGNQDPTHVVVTDNTPGHIATVESETVYQKYEPEGEFH